MNDSFLTIKEKSEGIYKESGSKFISFCFPVETESQADLILADIRKKYYDATHHCYAYRIGHSGSVFKTFDAGEPRHSAGDPILNQIRSFELSDILVVVVRYFGGKKLGKRGLINAYKVAAHEAISQAQVVPKVVKKEIKLEFEYAVLNEVMKIISSMGIHIINENYAETCSISFTIRASEVQWLMNQLLPIKHLIKVQKSVE